MGYRAKRDLAGSEVTHRQSAAMGAARWRDWPLLGRWLRELEGHAVALADGLIASAIQFPEA